MRKVFLVFLAFAFMIGGTMIAEEQKIPPEVESLAAAKLITIEPNNIITVSMNKQNGSEYKNGEKISFTVKITKPGYLYIIDMPEYGMVTQIFPNYYQQKNFFNPGTYKIPSTSDYNLTVSGTRSGVEFVQFILSSKPIDVLQQFKVSKDNPFQNLSSAQKESFTKFKENLAKSISVIPDTARWTAWTYFYFNAGETKTTLNVQSIPAGAHVTVDNLYSALTPAIFQVSPGYHDITLSLSGYQTWNGNVFVGIGENKSVNIPLVPIQQNLTGILSINVFPSNANVYVDDQFVGKGDQTLTVSAGYHAVFVRLYGYESYYTTILVNANQTTYLNVNLVPLSGNLYVYSQPYVQIYIDGIYAGGTGYSGYTYITGIPVGYHEIKFSKEWYISQKMNYNVNPGDNYLSVNLTQAGMLKVDSNVYPIKVKIDGQDYGQIESADKGVLVPIGSHNVELSNPQYVPYSADLNFAFQKVTEIPISLELKPLEISLNISPNPFSPNGDWFEDTTNFYVTLSRSGYVQISVYASNDSVVWYRDYNASYGRTSVTWNGNDLNGNPMPNGVYKVVATVQSYGQSASAQMNVVIDRSHYTYLKEILLIGGILLLVGLVALILY